MLLRILRLPAVILGIAITVAAIVQSRFPFAIGMPSFAVGMTAGAIVMVVAVAIAVAAMLEMRRHRTTVEPGQTPTALVTSGVFAVTRNPIYVAMLVLVIGLALMANALWFVVAAAILGIALDRVVIRGEERVIEQAFGEPYRAYKRRVRRWL